MMDSVASFMDKPELLFENGDSDSHVWCVQVVFKVADIDNPMASVNVDRIVMAQIGCFLCHRLFCEHVSGTACPGIPQEAEHYS